jgi:hypothetical protein
VTGRIFDVSKHEWDALTNIERAFFINSYEIDILPGVFGDLSDAEKDLPLPELAAILMSLIGQGWIGMHRYIPWTAPDGREGTQPGDLITDDALSELLADPRSWDYATYPGTWVGAPTLVTTETGLTICRLSPSEIEEQNRR